MAGVGKLLKQAQKMQKQMQVAQSRLRKWLSKFLAGEVPLKLRSRVKVNSNQFVSIWFLKEDADFVHLLSAVQEASAKAKEKHEATLSSLSGGIGGMPGLF